MKRPRLVPLLAAAALVPGLLVAPPATAPAAAHEVCATGWGSLPEAGAGSAADGDVVVGVRAGRHACFDRLVVDLAGDVDPEGYSVRYAPTGSELGTGAVVPTRGGAVLEVLVEAGAHDADHTPTYLPADRAEVVDVRGSTTLQQVTWGGSYERQTLLNAGVRGQLPFRAFTLPGADGTGTRLVVDVAHTW